jgi:polyisoprenyl-phosphate glycosyltransferase
VDDGSTDGSTDIIRELAKKDKRVRPVIFARNFGHQIAITAGWDYARGDAVVVIDADLQDPPELILEMAKKWKEGYEVVYAVRAEREGESWFKLWTASLFYRIIYRITDVKIPLDTGDFRLMDRKVVDVLNRCASGTASRAACPPGWDSNRSAWNTNAPPVAGETKYPFQKDVPPGAQCHHGLFLFPLAGGDLLRVCLGGVRHPCDPRGHLFAGQRLAGVLWSGDHTDRGAVPRRCAVDLAGNPGRIHRPPVR